MQGEYTGKPIFRRRYVGMDEDAIRDEINRLQDELYAMQDALDYMQGNEKFARNQMQEAQLKNERLLKSLDEKFARLQRSIDYEAPIKTQIEKVTADLKAMVEQSNDAAWKKLTKIMYLNTALLSLLCILLIISFVFF